jgi:catechol 2,3-dioxygenase-like lactoylglutathione lyase family enzyme
VVKDSDVSTRLPAQDLARARAFYAEKLGLEPVEERPAWFRDSEGNLLGIGQAVRERQGR